ncbi:MAG: 2,3-bisphosphoglycerate-independent phosphoglycerate mutase [Pseudomonadota bacterium]
MPYTPVVLTILDGWGLSDRAEGNAPRLAHTPHMDRLLATAPSATLTTCGGAVGLPEGQMGNSEVGHLTIGAGRTVWMDLPRIDQAIADGSFVRSPAWATYAAQLAASGGAAHVLGLASPGGVHSHQRHMQATAHALAEAGIPIVLHLITDGRDVGPKTARDQIAALLKGLEGLPDRRIATVMGRFWAMDRDHRWERVKRAWSAIALAEGARAPDPLAAIDAAYARGETDEFIAPTVIEGHAGIAPSGCDGLVCTNFRADRAREILDALLDPSVPHGRDALIPLTAALGMVSYSESLDRRMPALFPPTAIPNTLGEWVASQGRRQIRLAETEKYPHVTFFLNGGRETPFAGEVRHMAPSPKVTTYDLAPEMAAAEVTEHLVRAIRERYDLVVVNFANPDMVGHTGDLAAAVRACEAVDRGLGRALEALAEVGGAMLVTADHGNCEIMVAEGGGPHTAHTLNPVPVSLVAPDLPGSTTLAPGRLSDLAPTLLALMGLPVPPEMTGRSLIRTVAP